MTSMVIDCDELPNTIMSYFQTGKVELVEKGGRVTLSPVDDEDPVAKRERQLAAIRKARGMWKGLGSSSEKFMRNKKFEKALEG